MEHREIPFYDKYGKEIKEFAVLKLFHFKGVNEQGRGRKNYYMYKWVRLKEYNGTKYWIAKHLMEDTEFGYFHLRSIADKNKVVFNAEIVQQP